MVGTPTVDRSREQATNRVLERIHLRTAVKVTFDGFSMSVWGPRIQDVAGSASGRIGTCPGATTPSRRIPLATTRGAVMGVRS
jgi:hypothetical protein